MLISTLYSTIYSIFNKDLMEQVDELGTKFVTEELSRNGFWGDTESLLAVSNM